MMTPCGTTTVRVMAALVLTLLVGCAPFVSPYRYISLEKIPGIEVTETADPEIDRAVFVEGAFFVNPIPLGYMLQRSDYLLHIRVPRRSLSPVLLFHIEPRDGSKLKMTEFVPVTTEMGHSGVRYDSAVKEGEIGFSWILGDSGLIGARKVEADKLLKISFEVLNDVGNVIAKESLPFEIKSNGFFWVWDSL